MATYDKKCATQPVRGKGCVWDPSQWVGPFRGLVDAVRNNTTPIFMGSIHPRLKSPVGFRLAAGMHASAYGGDGALSGPTLTGCTASSSDPADRLAGVSLTFDAKLLGSERVAVRDFDTDMANTWADQDAASMMVCISQPSVKILSLKNLSTACANPNDYNPDGVKWVAAPVKAAGTSSVTIDLSKLNITAGGHINNSSITLVALRYGWPMDDLTCCPHNTERNGLAPCVPGLCPIHTSTSYLPANPFYANIVWPRGKCQCNKPQQCGQ